MSKDDLEVEQLKTSLASEIKAAQVMKESLEARLASGIKAAPIMKESLETMKEALANIRFAGNNTTAWAVWAQKMAAWGMEPDKWPKPEALPPAEESTT